MSEPVFSAAKVDSSKFDKLAHEACNYVFNFMIDETPVFIRDSHIIGAGAAGRDLFAGLEDVGSGFYSISVGYVGDAEGKIVLSLTRALAEGFTCKLLDAPGLDWMGADPRETMNDTMGELGNSFVGLVKGALTKYYPSLTLTTPRVNCGSRIRIDQDTLNFRKQYQFTVMGFHMLVDICHR